MQLMKSRRARLARRAGVVTACLMPAAALAQDAAEPLWVKPTLEAGQTMRFEFGMDLALMQKTAGSDAAREINRMQAGVLELTVDEVGPDGSALVSASVDRVAVTIREGDNSVSYTSMGDVPKGDDAPAWAGLGKMLTGADITFAVTSEGKVESVSGLSEFTNAAAESAPGADLAGLFSPQVFARTIEPVFSVDGAPGERRVAGRTWQTQESVNLGAVGVLDYTHEFRLAGIESGRAIMVGIPSVEVRRPTQAREGVGRVAVDDSTGYTRIEYGVADQQVKLREQVVRLATTWTLGEPETEGYVKIEQVQNSKLTLKMLED